MKLINKIILLCLISLKINGQEPTFVQFYNNPIYLNPSLSGEHKWRVSSIFSKNWSLLPSSFNNQLIAFDGQLESKNRKIIDHENPTLNYSLLYRGNKEGDLSLKTDEFHGGIGTRFQVLQLIKVGFGISMKIGRKSIDWSKAIFVSDLDPILGINMSNNFIPPNFNSFWYKNASVGMSFRLRNHVKLYDWQINGGFNHSNFINQKNSFFYNGDVNNAKSSIFLTFRSIRKNYRINTFYQQQLFSKTFQINSEMKFRSLIAGITYRTQFYSSTINNILGPSESLWFNFSYLVEFEDNKFFNISYSSGLTLSELGFQDTFFSHEISMKIFRLSENELSYKHDKDWFCPSDKQVRKELKTKKIDALKKNNKRKSN
tara:strand:- start:158 stop:1276 length:1119 start_codon:yes stop_codon:yes gene_type:complete